MVRWPHYAHSTDSNRRPLRRYGVKITEGHIHGRLWDRSDDPCVLYSVEKSRAIFVAQGRPCALRKHNGVVPPPTVFLPRPG